MLDVISAPPGTGKTLKCVQILEDTVRKNPNRMIFTNIIGINIPGVLPIKSSSHQPFDYRDCPPGSLIIYDEAHEHPAFSRVDLLKNYTLPDYVNDIFDAEVTKVLNYPSLHESEKIALLKKHKFVYTDLPSTLLVKQQEEIIKSIRNIQKFTLEKKKEDILDIGRSLTMHRHFGYDIVLVTQKPDLLNSFVKAASSQHLILRRLFKFQIAIIYSYAEIQEQFGNATRKNALSWSIWFFPKRLFKYYISAEEHTAKAAAPLGLTLWLVGLLGLIGFAVYNTSSTDAELFGASEVHASQSAQSNQQSNQLAQNPTGEKQDKPNPQSDLLDLCRMAANVDTPQCKKFFDDLSANGGSLEYKGEFQYDPARPYDANFIPSDIKPKDFPRFKNTIVYNGKCTAYSQQGTIMHEVSSKDCWRLAKGDRPFDYFYEGEKNNQSYTYAQAAPEQQQQQVQNPQVNVEPIPLGSTTRQISGAHAL